MNVLGAAGVDPLLQRAQIGGHATGNDHRVVASSGSRASDSRRTLVFVISMQQGRRN